MTEIEEIDSILDTFTTDGWKFIVEDIKKHYDAINNIDGINNEKELYQLQGEIRKLKWFMNLEDWYKNARDNIDPV